MSNSRRQGIRKSDAHEVKKLSSADRGLPLTYQLLVRRVRAKLAQVGLRGKVWREEATDLAEGSRQIADAYNTSYPYLKEK